MKYFKISLVLIITFTFVFTASVNQERALDVAENFYYSKNNPDFSDFSVNEVELMSFNNENTFYVIKLFPQGFILVAADDLVMPILGYSFDNNFISTNMPENIQYVFNLYSSEITEVKNSNTQDRIIQEEWEKFSDFVNYEPSERSVSPLIAARFNQDDPWNAMCPEDSQGPGGNAYAGCVAVSMAQIMHYWSYPYTGYGSKTYWASGYGYQTADFGNAYYDYNSMPNNTASSETMELLYHAAVSVNMNFDYDGSGAQVFGSNPSAYYAMRNYFLFKNTMSQVYPGQYSEAQYRSLLQTELNENRPIIYVGFDNDGGHAWNIDGYDDEYFHQNWGWGGYQNGYYLLSTLNGLNQDQGALINIEPETLEAANVVLQDYSFEEQVGDGDSVVNPGETINLYLTLENLPPWNNSATADLILTTSDPYLNIVNEFISVNYLAAGNSVTTTNSPFIIEFSEDINYDSHQLELMVVSTSTTGESDVNNYYLDLDVSLQQSGFPYALTLSGEDVVTVVQSSPNIIDINNDNSPEIFFGDNNGYVHALDSQGNLLNGFPVELPEGTSKDIWGSPAVADIDNDGEYEIAVISKNKHAYIIDEFGNIEMTYNANQFLMGTTSLANLDNDDDLEIIFSGYSTSGKVFAINHDGTDVNNFPVNISEKILRGAAIYDINMNGKDDIVVATENDKVVSIIYDDGSIDNLFYSDDKFKSAPSVIDMNNEIIIVVGDDGGHLYGINIDGTLKFDLVTNDNISSEAGFIEFNNQLAIFIGSEDGYLYGIDTNGNNLTNWPQDIGGKVNSSPVFSDIDNDGNPEVITATEEGLLVIYHLDGTSYQNYPISMGAGGFVSSPTVLDLDNDNDNEIIIGTTENLSIFDIKEIGSSEDYYWNNYRGDNHNTGSYIYQSEGTIGDLNDDGIIDVLDLVTTINIIMDLIEPNSSQLFTGDINSDGIIDILDVVQLVNMILA